MYIRTFAKILGSACIDVEAEDDSLLSRLKSHTREAEYSITDRSALASLEKLLELLADVDGVYSDEDRVQEEDLVEEMKHATLEENEEGNNSFMENFFIVRALAACKRKS